MTSTITFLANECVTESNQYGVLVLELSGAAHYLRLQKSTRADAPFGGIHFECDGQGWGAYDVVQSATFRRECLSIGLVESVREEFAGRLKYEVELQLSDEALKECRQFLMKIFSGTTILKLEP